MQVKEHEPLARLAWWRVGGPAGRFVVVETAAELAAELRETGGRPPLVLGNGSNLLAPDEGIAGTVLRLGGDFRATEVVHTHTRVDGRAITRVRVGAGLPNTVLLNRLQKLRLGGAASLAGVPGTMGGAIAMNAGTTLGEIGDVVHAVEGIDAAGELRTLARDDLPMRYREGGLPAGFVVTAAVLNLTPDGFPEEQEAIAHHLARRKATQPIDLPSCGSTFRNPQGDTAGRLIEAAGMKGHREGAAEISRKHANFIVNLGDATATDVMRCIRAAWEGVRAHAGVSLHPEVHVVGRWDAAMWPLG